LTKNKQPTVRDLRQFGLMMSGFLLLLTAARYWRHHHWSAWLIGLAALFAIAGVALPRQLRPIYTGWTRFGRTMGWINSRVLLTIIFLVFVVPVGLLRRVFGGDPLERKLDRSAKSYWQPAEVPTDREALRHQY
jgi:hypothetical protein